MARPRLQLPSFLEPPADVLANLRLIDPTIELVYMGGGAWAIGSVERTGLRQLVGDRKVATALKAKPTTKDGVARCRAMLWEGRLLQQGFALIHTFKGDPDSRVEEWLRARDYQWASDLDARWRELLADEMRGDEETEDERLARYSPLTDEKKLADAYRWAFKRPVSITKPTPAPGVAA